MIRLIHGEAREVLRSMEPESVHTVVTSPPYWGLRAYGSDPGMIGLEPTVGIHLEALLEIFREVHRVLRPEGTLWLNYGDSYAGSRGNYCPTGQGGQRPKNTKRFPRPAYHDQSRLPPQANAKAQGLKLKDLMMLPARVAMALQADGAADHEALVAIERAGDAIVDEYYRTGETIPDRVRAVLDSLDREYAEAKGESWWLRSEIVWHKPNPMPESVRDRPSGAHEKVFLFAKSRRYLYDAEAVRVPSVEHSPPRDRMTKEEQQAAGANLRNVWTIPPANLGLACRQCYKIGAELIAEDLYRCPDCCAEFTRDEGVGHFATFPAALAETCIRAGCPEDGIVLDPFAGIGTTGLVAARLNRPAVLIEINADYAQVAARRIREDSPLFAEVALEGIE